MKRGTEKGEEKGRNLKATTRQLRVVDTLTNQAVLQLIRERGRKDVCVCLTNGQITLAAHGVKEVGINEVR